MGDILFSAENLFKSYLLHGKRLEILKGASFRACAGETIAITGRSGAGKSTLLHILGGLDRPDWGQVKIGSTPITRRLFGFVPNARLRAEKIGLVFQAYHLLPEMDILENVMLPAMATGRISRREMRERAGRLLERVGLSDRLTHTPLELSGGEQQRAAIARALINEPPVILADEPTGNLDAATGDRVLDLLFELVRERQAVLIMVTHNPDTAATCSRHLVLENGVLVEA